MRTVPTCTRSTCNGTRESGGPHPHTSTACVCLIGEEAVEQRSVFHDAHVSPQVVLRLGKKAVGIAVTAFEVHALGVARTLHHRHLRGQGMSRVQERCESGASCPELPVVQCQHEQANLDRRGHDKWHQVRTQREQPSEHSEQHLIQDSRHSDGSI
jgi:hypothetical protein